MQFHPGMLPFRKQCNKKENVPFPFHPNQSRRAVLSIALIFVFNSSLYFSSWLYYHTPKTLGGIHLEQSKQIYSLLFWAPHHCFLFAQLFANEAIGSLCTEETPNHTEMGYISSISVEMLIPGLPSMDVEEGTRITAEQSSYCPCCHLQPPACTLITPPLVHAPVLAFVHICPGA